VKDAVSGVLEIASLINSTAALSNIQMGRRRGHGYAFRAALAILPKACPPSHLCDGVLDQASMGIVCESGENAVLSHRQVAFHIVETNVAWIDKPLLIG
jgi:hypothetical protein